VSANGVGAGRNEGGVGDGREGNAAADGNLPMAGASPHLLRSIRWWLRAFPPRWRRVHERETTDLLLELAPERSRRLDARTAVGLLVGGWGTRWRGRPSVGRYLGYLFELTTIDPAHREWARDDIESRWYPLRRALVGPAFFGAFVGIMNLAMWLPSREWAGVAGPMLRPWTVLLPPLIAFSYAQRRTIRRRSIVRHLLPRPGEPASASVYWPAPTPRPRTSAASALVQLVVVGALLLVSGAITVACASTMNVVSGCDDSPGCVSVDEGPLSLVVRLVMATVAIIIPALVAWRRLRTRSRAAGNLAVRPAQPARGIVRIRWDVAPWAIVGLALGLAWQAAEIFDGWPVIAAPACLTIGGTLLVWASIGRWVVRHGQGPDSVSEPVAWIDVWRTMHHTELLIDKPEDGYTLAPNAATTSPMTFPPGCATDDGTRVG